MRMGKMGDGKKGRGRGRKGGGTNRIIKIPHCDLYALFDLHISPHAHLIIDTLLGQIRRIRRLKQANIQLRDGDLDTHLHKGLHIRHLCVETRGLADDEVRFESHPIDADPVILEELHDFLTREIGSRAGVLDVVVIVVELGGRVGHSGRAVGDPDVFRSEDLETGVVAIGAVVVEGFVDDVPCVALPGPVFGFVVDVGDESGGEVLFGPGEFGYYLPISLASHIPNPSPPIPLLHPTSPSHTNLLFTLKKGMRDHASRTPRSQLTIPN